MIPDLSEIKLLRKRLGMTQQQLAKSSGISQSLLAKIESGRVEPSYSKAVSLFNVLYRAESGILDAQKIMQKKVISVNPKTRVAKAIAVMKKHNISQLPVMDNGQAIGLLSESTILAALLEKKGDFVGEIMDEPPPVISTKANSKIVSQILKYYPIVLVSEKGKVKGVITKSDILAGF
ncbi:MAG: CBS domain-containing protein [Candidatus Woesearchaeota archaeon]